MITPEQVRDREAELVAESDEALLVGFGAWVFAHRAVDEATRRTAHTADLLRDLALGSTNPHAAIALRQGADELEGRCQGAELLYGGH